MMRIIKRTRLVVVSVIVLAVPLLELPTPVLAHIVRQDHDVYAEMHIEPNDEPQAKESTNIVFEVGLQTGKFTAADCQCSVKAVLHDKTVATGIPQTEEKEGEDQIEARVTFPQIGTYNVVFSGHSKSGSFADFTLTYPATVKTVARNAQQNERNDRIAIAVLGLVTVGTTGIFIVMWLLKRRKPSTP